MIPVERTDVLHYPMVWVVAKRRDTGQPVAVGLWAGGEDATFVVDGQTRDFFGAGGLLEVQPITSRSDLTVQSQRIQLSGVATEVEDLVRGHEVKGADIEIHVARFDPGNGGLIAIDLWYRGTVDRSPISIPAKNEGQATIEVEIVSRARDLTRTLTTKRSDESQRRRGGDRFFQYADVGPVKRGE